MRLREQMLIGRLYREMQRVRYALPTYHPYRLYREMQRVHGETLTPTPTLAPTLQPQPQP